MYCPHALAGDRDEDIMDLPEPSDLIPRLVRSHNALIGAFEKQCGLHLARWRLLFCIGRLGQCSQRELAHSTTMEPAAVTRILADLDRQGLISRATAQHDARQLDVTLTPAGQALVRETAGRRETFLRAALEGFSDAEAEMLDELLGRLQTNLATLR